MTDDKAVNNKLLLILFAIVLIPWGLTLFGLGYDSNTRGTFGDMFGAVNALFSGLAFAGLIYALLMQQKELTLQREQLQLQHKELIQNTNELKRAATAQESSEKALTNQIAKMVDASKLTALSSLLSSYDSETHRNATRENMEKVNFYRTEISEVLFKINENFDDEHTTEEPYFPPIA